MSLSAVAALAVVLLEPPAAPAPAPTPDPVAMTEHRRRVRLNFGGMATLTAWSVANIAGGLAGNFTSEGQLRYFHQGNAAWNSVNLVLGVIGLVNAGRSRNRVPDRERGRADARKSQLAYAINASLDVVYAGVGVSMGRLGTAHTQPRIAGYGQALVLQGSFLFAFDVAMMLGHEILLNQSGRTSPLARLRPALAPRFTSDHRLDGVALTMQLRL